MSIVQSRELKNINFYACNRSAKRISTEEKATGPSNADLASRLDMTRNTFIRSSWYHLSDGLRLNLYKQVRRKERSSGFSIFIHRGSGGGVISEGETGATRGKPSSQ